MPAPAVAATRRPTCGPREHTPRAKRGVSAGRQAHSATMTPKVTHTRTPSSNKTPKTPRGVPPLRMTACFASPRPSTAAQPATARRPTTTSYASPRSSTRPAGSTAVTPRASPRPSVLRRKSVGDMSRRPRASTPAPAATAAACRASPRPSAAAKDPQHITAPVARRPSVRRRSTLSPSRPRSVLPSGEGEPPAAKAMRTTSPRLFNVRTAAVAATGGGDHPVIAPLQLAATGRRRSLRRAAAVPVVRAHPAPAADGTSSATSSPRSTCTSGATAITGASSSRPCSMLSVATAASAARKASDMSAVEESTPPATPGCQSLCSAVSSAAESLDALTDGTGTGGDVETTVGVALEGLQVRRGCCLGEGAFGRVYIGRLGAQSVAVKEVVYADVAGAELSSGMCRVLVRHEAVLLHSLRHPNVLGLVGAAVTRERATIVTELCDDVTLEHQITRNCRATWGERVETFRGLARGLAAVHAHGYVHRDVKPANILFKHDSGDEDDLYNCSVSGKTVKLADFGLAAPVGRTPPAGAAAGSPPYVAPEACGGDVPGFAQDVYSFGVTLLEVLCGRELALPTGRPVEDVFARLAAGSIRLQCPPELDTFVPEPLRALATACTAHKAAARPTMPAVVADLEAAATAAYAERDAAGPGRYAAVTAWVEG